MAWNEAWHLKLRRRWQKPINKILRGRRPFVARYLGAYFLLRPHGIGTLEISAQISERHELDEFTGRCASLRPDILIDIGANIGLYSCILLKSRSVPRAILFEPDRDNLIQLRGHLLINGLLSLVEIHEVALGGETSRRWLSPGVIDGGFSAIMDRSPDGGTGYEIPVARLDDLLSIAGKRLAIKIDVERYECQVLTGMQRTLRSNTCLVQIEAFESKDQVIAMMAEAGYDLVETSAPNFVFENARASEPS
jgi:FkbM family methyltransferase